MINGNHVYLASDSHYLRRLQREAHLATVVRLRALQPEQQERYLDAPVDSFRGELRSDVGLELQAKYRRDRRMRRAFKVMAVGTGLAIVVRWLLNTF